MKPPISITHSLNSTASPVNLAGEEKGIGRSNQMGDENDVKGIFRYDQDSKRYHRFKVEIDNGIVGTIYVPKNKEKIPNKIVLERKH